MTPDLPQLPVPETTPNPSPETHYSFKIDKKVVFMGIVILALIGIIASMQFCSNRKIEKAIQRLDSAKIDLMDAQNKLISASRRLDSVRMNLGKANGFIDNSDKIIRNISDKMWDLSKDIEQSKLEILAQDGDRKKMNEEMRKKIQLIDTDIQNLKNQLKH